LLSAIFENGKSSAHFSATLSHGAAYTLVLTNWHILGDLFSKTHLVTLLSTLGYDI
jgi:hypothetical protein